MTNPNAEAFANPYADVLRESRSGNYTWVNPSDRASGPRISFTWLMWQGAEYHVEFADTQSRDLAAKAIFERFGPESEKAVLKVEDRYAYIRSESYDGKKHDNDYRRLDDLDNRRQHAAKGEFHTTTMTILPHMVADLLPPDARIVIAPTSLKAREQLLKVGIDVFHREDVSYSPDMLPEPLPVQGRSLVHLDGDVRIENRGDLGVCLVSRGEEGPCSKWFLDAAAEQILSHRKDRDWLSAFAEKHVGEEPGHDVEEAYTVDIAPRF
jgi:hypothetical protein